MSDNTEHPGEHHDVTKAQRDNPPNKSILALVLATLTTLAVVVLAVVQYFNMSVREEIDRKVESAGNPVLNALRADEQLRLEHYGWVDQKKGVVRIPTTLAAELVLRDWEKRPTGVSDWTDTPAAAPATPPAPSPEAPAPAPGTPAPAPGTPAPTAPAPAPAPAPAATPTTPEAPNK